MALKTRKKKSTSIHAIRQSLKQDHSPNWDGSTEWSDSEFRKHFFEAMQYYNTLLDKKENKKLVLQWMEREKYDLELIHSFKKVKDWRCNSTLGGVVSCLFKGMPLNRGETLGNDISQWLNTKILAILDDSKNDIMDDDDNVDIKPKIDKNEEIINNFIAQLDGIIDGYLKNDNCVIKVDVLLKEHGVKAIHVPTIKSNYTAIMNELHSVINKTCDEQLKEAYSSHPIKFIRKLYDIYFDLVTECDKIVEASIKKPREPKPVSKDKLVAKLKFKVSDDKLGISSIDPITIIGAKELFLYDTKTRKLYRYISKDGGLTVKGTTIDNFDESLSVGKTLLKPIEQLTKFNKAGRIALSKFIDNLDTLDIVLLKVME